MARMHEGTVPALLRAFMRRSLLHTFARVEWVGPRPEVPPDRPVVLLSNHPSFYDGYLGWLVAESCSAGACSCGCRSGTATRSSPRWARSRSPKTTPPTAPRRSAAPPALWRVRTMRSSTLPKAASPAPTTARLPSTRRLLARLDRLLPPHTWLPLGLHLTWDGGDKPIVRMAAGAPTPALQGDERARLAALLATLRAPGVPDGPVTRCSPGPPLPPTAGTSAFPARTSGGSSSVL